MHTRDDIVAAARAVAERLGARKLSRAAFIRATGINANVIKRACGSWGRACADAGLARQQWGRRYVDSHIFESLRDAFVANGGVTSRSAMARHLRFHSRVLDRRFGSWRNTLVEFAAWIAANDPEFPHVAQLAERIAALPETPHKTPPIAPGSYWPSKGGTVSGEPLGGVRGLMYAPLNEDGVVLAFGMLAEDLGFSVEKVQKSFPDCVARRRVGAERWEKVRIEFEFRSRNFHDHGHDPAGCDVIVCWEHDWPGAPIEVLELKAALARLAAPVGPRK